VAPQNQNVAREQVHTIRSGHVQHVLAQFVLDVEVGSRFDQEPALFVVLCVSARLHTCKQKQSQGKQHHGFCLSFELVRLDWMDIIPLFQVI
jgi:hypothetical protein